MRRSERIIGPPEDPSGTLLLTTDARGGWPLAVADCWSEVTAPAWPGRNGMLLLDRGGKLVLGRGGNA